jgi:four helix bundle protein
MQDPSNLIVYQRALDYAVRCTRLTRRIRPREAPGLTAQISRSSCSVPSNISEGVGQPSSKACARFLGIAIGSLNECDTQLKIAKRLSPQLGDIDPLLEEAAQIRRMLFALRKHHLKKAQLESEPHHN